MSYGSISAEAHETLAIAMNRLGGKSNTGEGGEESIASSATPTAIRVAARSNRSRPADSASPAHYLTQRDRHPDQDGPGAKPGEGGQLPAGRCTRGSPDAALARPGVGLISPPPHHDIYSIEDLKQLIHDLKNANPQARIHVKLVASRGRRGRGRSGQGACRRRADLGARRRHRAALKSLKHAGTPWEIGLAETQQTLMLNGFRGRIVVQVDGQLKTGRDVIIARCSGPRNSVLRPRRWSCPDAS